MKKTQIVKVENKKPKIVKVIAKKPLNRKPITIVNQIKKNLENISTGYSKFEFENFLLEKYPTPARQLVEVMKRIELLHNNIEAMSKLSTSEMKQNLRQLTEMQNEFKMLSDWYNSKPNKEEILNRFEIEEPEYWSHVLGRTAAIEVLSYGKTTKETMDKMSHLPEKYFEDAVQICLKFTTMITSMTETVEQVILGSNEP